MKYVPLIVAIGVLAFFVGRYFYHIPEFKVGVEAPTFTAELQTGEAFDFQKFNEGKLVLIDFWGSWCGPCRKENPEWVALYKEFSDREYEGIDGFEIVGVGVERNEKAWKNAIAADGLLWPTHILQSAMFSSPIVDLYGITEIPSNYLINPNGVIVGVNMTAVEVKKQLFQYINKG